MNMWSSMNNYLLNKCTIQAYSSTDIGWIVYSSEFTDTERLKKYLEWITYFEWGFKMGVLTNANAFKDEERTKRTEWKNRKKPS